MRKTRRTEITVETDEVVVIRRTGGAVQPWCPQCGQLVGIITPDEAVILSSVNARTIYRLIEGRKIHYAETAEGFLHICLRSLSLYLIEERSDFDQINIDVM